jgi:hypothetical protein
MTTKVAIANLALTELGAPRITNLTTDNTPSANAVNAVYDLVVDEVIAEHDWKTCSKRAQLAQLSDAPAYEYDYQYQLPTNPKCIEVREVYNNDTKNFDYTIEGDMLLTDESTVYIRYTARLTNESEFGLVLQTAIVKRLIAAIAYTLTGNRIVRDQAKQDYLIYLANAKANDSVNTKPIELTNDTLLWNR